MINMFDTIAAGIPQFDHQAAQSAQLRQNRLTKPTGSLGQLEALSIRLAGMTGQAIPNIDPAVIFVYAGDHGVTKQNISPYPSEVTTQMVLNYARGGAVINTLAKEINARLIVTDVGVTGDLPSELPIRHRKIRRGTADWTTEPAMTADEAIQAIRVGIDVFDSVSPIGLAIVGEMGIGNTTTAAALAAALTGSPVRGLVGRGAGIDAEGVARKIEAVEAGLARISQTIGLLEILSELGGLEICAMAGTILAAARKRVPVVLDGFISTCAGLIAVQIAPGVREFLIASHKSPEPGQTVLLNHLKLSPLLDLGLRLGEASGAALAVPLLRASVAVLRDVATFDEAGVSDRPQEADA